MLRLATLGGVTLTRDGASVGGAIDGWRRRGLLALLAAAGARGVSRELLSAMLWPDSPPERGRHSLQQTLYSLRKALGSEELFDGTQSLRFDTSVIAIDVAEFEQALANHQFERAASLYGGPFADDVDVENDAATELQRRLAVHRVEYARKYVTMLESAASAASERGQHTAAAKWWQRLAEVDPHNARFAKEYIAAMVASGERARALKFALVHEALVRDELNVAVEPEISNWILQLRAVDHATPRSVAAAAPLGVDDDPAEQHRLARVSRAVDSRYRIDRLIGENTVTADYSATLRKDASSAVEIRVIQPRLAAGTTTKHFSGVFDRVVGLADPRVLPTIDYGASDDLLFVVSVRRAQQTLRDRLRRETQLSIPDALSIARDVAGALAHAHQYGVRHGDLRPKHIDLTGAGALISGLGFVEALTGSDRSGDGSTIVTLGSPVYSSPEQVMQDATVDARCDVYAFGCILYEMLAGEPPFGRSGKADAIRRKLTQQPAPLRTHRDRVPPGIEEIADRCLARVPADRFSSGVELARALADVAIASTVA